MRNMKTTRSIITAFLLLVLASCQKPFEKEYGLEVDSNEYVVSIYGKTFPVYVYCSSAWTAAFESPVAWAEIIEGNSGEGVGMVKINVLPNYGDARSVNLILKSGSLEQVIVIRQNVFAVDYYATFDNKNMEMPSGAYLVKTRLITNIPPEVLGESRAAADARWISGITPYKILSDNQVIGTNRKIEVEFSFVVQANETPESRIAVFGLGVPSDYTEEMERVQTLTVEQTAQQAYISVEKPGEYNSEAQDCCLPLDTNLALVASDINVSSSELFVNNIRIETEGQTLCLRLSLTANNTGSSRESSIVLSYCDLEGNITRETITIHQD